MSIADDAIAFARAQIGKPYRFGAAGPDAYDCSGLMVAAFNHAGLKPPLPRTTYLQLGRGAYVPKHDLLPGDLVFPDAGHVQLYVGNGQIIESPHEGANVRQVAMWGYTTARRVTVPGVSPDVAPPDSKGFDVNATIADIKNSINAIDSVFSEAGKTLDWLAKPANWKRIGIFTAGAGLMFVGIVNADRAKALANTATQATVKAVQNVKS